VAERSGLVQPLVLGAGLGRRFGADGGKLTAPLAGVPLISHLLAALERSVERHLVAQPLLVVQPQAAPLIALARAHGCVVETVSSDALSTSLRAGVSARPDAAAWLMLLADQPFSTAVHWRPLIVRWQAGAQAVFSDGGHGPQPPAIFDHSLGELLKNLTGDRGASQLIGRLTQPPAVVRFSPGLWMRDIDTRQDLLEIEGQIKARQRGRTPGLAGGGGKGPGSAGSAP